MKKGKGARSLKYGPSATLVCRTLGVETLRSGSSRLMIDPTDTRRKLVYCDFGVVTFGAIATVEELCVGSSNGS